MIDFEKFLILKTISIFKNTPDEILTEIIPAISELRVPAGYAIVKKGDSGNSLYIIVEGKANVHDGDKILSEINSREIFGELSALSPQVRIASVTATEDSILYKIEHDDLYNFMEAHSGLAKGIIEFLCERVRQVAQQKS